MSTEVIEQAEQTVAEPVVETTTDEQLPVRAHALKYSEEGRRKEAEALANETPEQKAARAERAAQQKRDRESGQFREGKNRHRPESQKARPEDVPRINQLTARAKTAEERVVALEAELSKLKAAGAPRQEIARAEAKVEAATEAAKPVAGSTFKEPEPTEDDPKFEGDYGKYLRAVSAWEGRKAFHESKEAERQQTEQLERDRSERTAMQSLAERMESAKERYPDFDEVAYGKPAPWLLQTGPIRGAEKLDQWIRKHKSGPDVLYYFQQDRNRQELDSLLAKEDFEQVEVLTLLAQRLLPTSSEQAGVTGSAAGRNVKVKLPPPPPNPVRTEAQRTSGGPPPTDGSLGVLAHAKTFKRPS